MTKKPSFIFDPIQSEEDFETAVFWDSPAIISQLRKEARRLKKKNG